MVNKGYLSPFYAMMALFSVKMSFFKRSDKPYRSGTGAFDIKADFGAYFL